MKTERFIQEWQTPNGFLSKASLEQLMPYAKTGHFPRGSIVCTSDQLGECVYLVLKGRCELRHKAGSDGRIGVQSFDAGQIFGGSVNSYYSPGGEVTAIQDSVVLAARAEDLEGLAAKRNGESVVAPEKNNSSNGSNTSFFFTNPGNRVVSFVFMSNTLPLAILSERAACQLQEETGKQVVLVQFDSGVAADAGQHEDFDHKLDGTASLPDELYRDEAGLHKLRLKFGGEPPDPEVIGEVLRKLRRRFHFVIVAALAEQLPGSFLFGCLMWSDAAHFFLRPSVEDLYQLDLLLHALRPNLSRRVAAELKPVLCLAPGETIGSFDERMAAAGMANPLLIRACPQVGKTREPVPEDAVRGLLFRADIRRLARTIGNCVVGLALSSGGAKGLAHIGVIQVMEENGLEVDVVAGASMGAYVGAIWAFGYAGDKLEELAREMETKRAMWSLLDPVLVPWQGFMRGYAVKRRLQRSIGMARFADLARPLRVVAAQIDTMERVVFATGNVATAVHASIAVPGICIPVPIDGERYVDGGIVDPVPTDVLQEMGINKIIAVNTIPTPDRIRYCLQAAQALARQAPSKSRSVLRKLLPPHMHVNQYAHAHILDILMHSTHGAQMRVAEASSRRADIVLQPDICDDRWLDFRNPGFYIRAGREVALRHLDKIKALIKEKGAPHEHEPTPYPLAEAV